MTVLAFYLFFPLRGATPQARRWLLILLAGAYLGLLYLCLRTGSRGGLLVVMVTAIILVFHVTRFNFAFFRFSFKQVRRYGLLGALVLVALTATGAATVDLWKPQLDRAVNTINQFAGRTERNSEKTLNRTGGATEGLEGEVRFHYWQAYWEAISTDERLRTWGEGFIQDDNKEDRFPGGNTLQTIQAPPHNYFFGTILFGGLVYAIPSYTTLVVVLWLGFRLIATHRALRPEYLEERILLSGFFYANLIGFFMIIMFENQSYFFHEWNYQAAFCIAFFCASLTSAMRYEARRAARRATAPSTGEPFQGIAPQPH
ncbi:MAG: hypothetical protein HC876_14510 [Chloroflexaceae bacterium]|nr:hypothetical protein [Chloroflexaceae bacterium]